MRSQPRSTGLNNRGVLNTVMLFCLSLLLTGIMFQRATTSVQRTESEVQAVTAATDAAIVSGGGTTKKYAPEITQIISNILTKAKEAVGMNTADDGQLDAEEAQQLVKTLLGRVKPALAWASALPKELNRFDRISHAEIHILYKLYRFLKLVDGSLTASKGKNLRTDSEASSSSSSSSSSKTRTSKSSSSSSASSSSGGDAGGVADDLVELISQGYQCSSADRLQQEAIAKTIERDICSEIEWYKVVQLAWPEASTFIDIGANKGYLGSLFLSLWGGGGLGVSPASLYDVATKLKTWDGSKNTAGFCRDGLNHGIQLHCYKALREDSGVCAESRPSVRVYSIDGSSHLEKTMNNIIRTHLPSGAGAKENAETSASSSSATDGSFASASASSSAAPATVSISAMWRYFHYAASDHKGMARFTKQGTGAKQRPGFEGGQIRKDASEDTEEVRDNEMSSTAGQPQ